MRVVKFEVGENNGEGFLEEETIHVFGSLRNGPAAAAPFGLSRLAPHLLKAARRESGQILSLNDIRLATPVDPTAKILCVGLNYLAHTKEAQASLPLHPALFLKHQSAIVPAGDELDFPSCSDSFDYEGELAITIGQRLHKVDRAQARDAVSFFSCFMDGSVREFQQHSIAAGKNFYRSSSMGPWLTPADEIPSVGELQLRTLVNGEERQVTKCSEMIFDIPEIIAYCSSWTVLEPGDVIATGTPAGVGGSFSPPKWLKEGDRVEVNIPGVGSLVNTVGS